MSSLCNLQTCKFFYARLSESSSNGLLQKGRKPGAKGDRQGSALSDRNTNPQHLNKKRRVGLVLVTRFSEQLTTVVRPICTKSKVCVKI